MAMSLRGIYTTGYDPTVLRDYLEKAIEVELTEASVFRNLAFKVFRFPNNAWSYTYQQRGHVRATVIEELGAPPLVRPKTRKFGMEYHEIGIGIGITDKMVRFGDIPAMEMGTEAAIDAMELLQERDMACCAIASIPFWSQGSGTDDIHVRLQKADLKKEWETYTLQDQDLNRCSKQRSHVIVGDGNTTATQSGSTGAYPTPPDTGSGDLNLALLLKALNLGIELIEEHPQGRPNVLLINPKQRTDFRNLVDFSGSNKPSIPPPQFNAIMSEGWAGRWEGLDIISTHHMTPGTALMLDTSKYMILGEYGAPFVEMNIRDQWKAWEGATWRQYYQPACPNTDYGVLFVNLLGDTKPDNTTPLDHTVEADVNAQYTQIPTAGGERAGVPG